MTRISYIKPNSHTQRKATISIGVVECILFAANIEREDWLQLLFETGCRFAEYKYKEEALTFLTDEKFGFWAWWINSWLDDDEHLLGIYGNVIRNYSELKKEMIQ